MPETVYLTEAAYYKRHNALSRRLNLAHARWERWNREIHLLPYGTSASRRAFTSRDNAWFASVDAGNALAEFERTHAIKTKETPK